MNPYQALKTQTLIIAGLFMVVAFAATYFDQPTAVVAFAGTLAIVGLVWRLFRALQRDFSEKQFRNFRQIEALTGIYGTLDVRMPLPRTRHTAASPDFLHLLSCEIFRTRPELVVEVGSGTSTLIAAYCLKKLGRGKIVSLDHLEKYADITRQTIASHELGEFAEVIHAPLTSYRLDETEYSWYESKSLDNLERIDMLIVDGPPRAVSNRARYPAIPLLREKLHADSIILLDDGARPDEQETVELWKRRYDLDYSAQPMEKGAFLCRLERESTQGL